MTVSQHVRRGIFSAAAVLAALLVAPAAEAQRVSLNDLQNRIEALEDSVLDPGPGANLIGQDLSGVPLAGLDLRGLRAMEASGFGDLTDANMSFSDLRGADLAGVSGILCFGP